MAKKPLSLSEVRANARRLLKTINAKPVKDQVAKVRTYHALGKLLGVFHEQHKRSEFRDLVKDLGHNRRWGTDLQTFAEKYNKKQLEELCKMVKKNIRFGHVRFLFSLTDTDRTKWIKEAYNEGWSVLGLQREMVQKGKRPKTKNGRPLGGRPLGGGNDPDVRLRRLGDQTNDWIALYQAIRHDVAALPDKQKKGCLVDLKKKLPTAFEKMEALQTTFRKLSAEKKRAAASQRRKT
jgi:hypothetical protein